MGVGPICCEDHFLNSICYEVSVKQLIAEGFLSPVKAIAGRGGKVDWSQIQKRGGEFVDSSAQLAMDQAELTSEACREIVELSKTRQSILIFTTGINHAVHVKEQIEKLTGEEVGAIFGDTPSTERAELLSRFKCEKYGMIPRPALRWIVNVNVLTTGFDAPNVDCVVLLRPTMSPGLYYQMVGRGFRLHPGKADCLVLDYGGNALRHGPVDKLQIKTAGSRDGTSEAPAKECPKCHAVICTVYATCPECGHEFPPAPSKITPTSAGTPILSGEVTDEVIPVIGVDYSIHTKRGGSETDPRTMRVIYKVSLYQSYSEWICLEHSGWARQKAQQWWIARSDHPPPTTIEYAVDMAQAGVLAIPEEITLRHISGQRWPTVHAVKLGPKPELGIHMQSVSEEVPF
jgi:DNA repair protein RadD